MLFKMLAAKKYLPVPLFQFGHNFILLMSKLRIQMLLAVIVAAVQRSILPVKRRIEWLFLLQGSKNLSTGVSLTSF